MSRIWPWQREHFRTSTSKTRTRSAAQSRRYVDGTDVDFGDGVAVHADSMQIHVPFRDRIAKVYAFRKSVGYDSCHFHPRGDELAGMRPTRI
jgi:hypothetical protein